MWEECSFTNSTASICGTLRQDSLPALTSPTREKVLHHSAAHTAHDKVPFQTKQKSVARYVHDAQVQGSQAGIVNLDCC